jgi:hypothetical protein
VTRKGPAAASTWQDQPRSLYKTARGGTGPLPRGEGGPGPPRPVVAVWPVMVRPSHVAVRTPWGVRVRGGNPRALLPSWVRRGPGPLRAPGGSRDRGPSCQARVMCLVTQKAQDLLDAKGLDTLAGGTLSVCTDKYPYSSMSYLTAIHCLQFLQRLAPISFFFPGYTL